MFVLWITDQRIYHSGPNYIEGGQNVIIAIYTKHYWYNNENWYADVREKNTIISHGRLQLQLFMIKENILYSNFVRVDLNFILNLRFIARKTKD